MTWNLTAIRSKVRSLTGMLSTNQLSDSDLDTYVNTFYRDIFPLRLQPQELWQYTTLTTTAGQGEDSRPSDVLVPGTEWRISTDSGWVELWFTHDRDQFFDLYPDRDGSGNNQPDSVLWFADQFYWAPIPDDAYTIRFNALKRPSALSAAGDTPTLEIWGLAIAYGAAVQIKMDKRDFEAANQLDGVLEYRMGELRTQQLVGMAGKRSRPRF